MPRGRAQFLLRSSAAPKFPFGAHRAPYPVTPTLPNTLSLAAMEGTIGKFWNSYKANYLRYGFGGCYILGGGSDMCVSEGQGYGMLIAVCMAGLDPQARDIFDGIYAFGRAHPSSTFPLLMSYTITSTGTMPDPFPAADADIDMTLALLMAHVQWGSNGRVNYLKEALANLVSIKSAYLTANFSISANGTVTRSSDLMPAACKSFAKYTGDSSWTSASTRAQAMATAIQTNNSPSTGLLPDWISSVASTTVVPATDGQTGTDGSHASGYSYNACRDAWRFIADYVLNGDTTSQGIANNIANYFNTSTSAFTSFTIGERQLNGTVIDSFDENSFNLPVLAGCMGNSANQSFANAIWAHAIPNFGGGYFSDSIAMNCLLLMTNNVFNP
jgi:hypothetical protein